MMNLFNADMRYPRLLGAAFALLVALASPVQAQVFNELQTSGTAYFVYAEMGAPTMEVLMVGEGARTGIYKLQEGTTLTELLALSGGTPLSSETDRQIVEAFVRVLRSSAGGDRSVIYEATAEQAIREPLRHPDLQSGDIVETDVTYETVNPPLTLLDGLAIAARIASLVSVALILFTRTRNL